MALKTPEQVKQFEIDLDKVLKPYVDELRKSKGWSFANIANVFMIILSAAPTAVASWQLATTEQKKTACVNIANRYIDLPKLNEKKEAKVFGIVFDLIAFGTGLI